MSREMVHVYARYNGELVRIGSFYDQVAADAWISQRPQPKIFLVAAYDPEVPTSGGVFVSSDDKRSKKADAFGFIPNAKIKPIKAAGKGIIKNTKRQSDAIAEAIAKSDEEPDDD